MAKITALHISDLHWSAAEHKNLKIVVDALVADLTDLRAQGVKPDVVVWTGDLVQSGEDGDAFLAADDALFEPILAAVKLDRDRLFVVPGNHDISRKYVRETGYVEQGLKATLQTVDQVNAFVDGVASKSDAAKAALGRMDNFSAYMGAAVGRKPTFENPWLSTHTLDIEGVNIGVACFNTAWRATGEHENADRHELLMGERNVDLAIEALKETKLRFALFHHPLDWLADFDMSAVAARLYAQFDVLFYGHTHQTHPELRSGPTGTAILSQTGSVYQRRKYFNGYQLVQIDTDSNEVAFHVRTYFDHPRRAFDAATNIVPGGKSVFAYETRCDSAAFAHIEKVLREVRPVVRQSAADHLNIVKAIDELRLEPREAFICPPITWNRSVTTDKHGHIQNSLNADAILRSEDNFLIFGERESGKSSLAHYMAVLAAEGLVDRARIPVVLSLPELARHTHGLRKAVGAYLGATRTGLDIDAAMSAGDFIFFVDAVDIADTNVRQRLQKLIERTDGCRWILLANYRFGESETDGLEDAISVPFKSVHIHRLPRKAIRELARRWTQQSGGDNERTFATVMQHLESSNLPRTGYIVTLLLWAVHQGRSFERLNEAVLLTALVDHLLGRADFTQALRREFDAASKEITLQSLAVYLREKGGAVETTEAASFLSGFFKERGLPHDGVAILDALVECGILQARDGWLGFKYRCFLEYFFALKLRADGALLHQHLQGTAFLNVERELDLLSGLRRENEEIIAAVSHAVSTMAPPEIDNAKPENFEEIAVGDAATGLSRSKLDDIRKKKLTPDDIDDLVDAAEAKIAKRSPRKPEGPNGAQ